MTACATPIGNERWVAYWCNELGADEVAALDEHLFSCETCAAEAESVSHIVQAFRAALPPVVSVEQVAALRASGRVIRDNDFDPGARKGVVFDRDAELLIHHLRGLQLADAERVEVTVRTESGLVMLHDLFAPFDRERGEVLIACQRHFAALPADVVFDVRVISQAGALPTLATYFVPHEFL